jgi:hypothetical protein
MHPRVPAESRPFVAQSSRELESTPRDVYRVLMANKGVAPDNEDLCRDLAALLEQ